MKENNQTYHQAHAAVVNEEGSTALAFRAFKKRLVNNRLDKKEYEAQKGPPDHSLLGLMKSLLAIVFAKLVMCMCTPDPIRLGREAVPSALLRELRDNKNGTFAKHVKDQTVVLYAHERRKLTPEEKDHIDLTGVLPPIRRTENVTEWVSSNGNYFVREYPIDPDLHNIEIVVHMARKHRDVIIIPRLADSDKISCCTTCLQSKAGRAVAVTLLTGSMFMLLFFAVGAFNGYDE
jgi:hypothetical protein